MNIAAAITFLAALIAQPATSFFGEIPEGVQTYKLRESDGTFAFFALRFQKDWIEDLGSLPETVTQVTQVFDTPWEGSGSHTVIVSRLRGAEKETAVQRRQRLNKSWSEEYTFLGEQPVKTADLEYARRAEAMKAKVLSRNHPAAAVDAQAATESAEKVAPSFAQQWGGQIVLVLAGLALMGVVAKTLILES